MKSEYEIKEINISKSREEREEVLKKEINYICT